MRLQHWVANRLILRPTRHAVPANGLHACALPFPAGTLECFAARQTPTSQLPAPQLLAPQLNTPLSVAPQRATAGALVTVAEVPPKNPPASADPTAFAPGAFGPRAIGSADLPAGEFPWESTEPPELLILKLPGTGGRAERSTLFPASLLEDRTAEVWTLNPPGYGRSSGRATLAAIADAALHFYDWLDTRRRDSRTVVWVSGNSLGCATALHLAAARRVDGLVLRNPPPLVDLVRHRGGWWNLVGGGDWVASGIPHEMDAVATATEVFSPIVFIQSDADSLVLPALQQHVRDAHPGPQHTVHLALAEHDTPLTEADRPAITRAVQWLWETTTR